MVPPPLPQVLLHADVLTEASGDTTANQARRGGKRTAAAQTTNAASANGTGALVADRALVAACLDPIATMLCCHDDRHTREVAARMVMYVAIGDDERRELSRAGATRTLVALAARFVSDDVVA